MKRNLILILMLLSVLAFSSPASALLMRTTVDSTYVVVDDVNNVQWADPNRFLDMTYAGVIGEIDNMNTALFAGASDWQLASLTDIDQLFNEMTTVGDARQFDPTLGGGVNHAVNGRYERIIGADTHTGAGFYYPSADPNSSVNVTKENYTTNYRDDTAFPTIGAYVVSSATATAPVPEPATVLLLGTSLVGLVGLRRKFKT